MNPNKSLESQSHQTIFTLFNDRHRQGQGTDVPNGFSATCLETQRSEHGRQQQGFGTGQAIPSFNLKGEVAPVHSGKRGRAGAKYTKVMHSSNIVQNTSSHLIKTAYKSRIFIL